jgi:hypothetical protein
MSPWWFTFSVKLLAVGLVLWAVPGLIWIFHVRTGADGFLFLQCMVGIALIGWALIRVRIQDKP